MWSLTLFHRRYQSHIWTRVHIKNVPHKEIQTHSFIERNMAFWWRVEIYKSSHPIKTWAQVFYFYSHFLLLASPFIHSFQIWLLRELKMEIERYNKRYLNVLTLFVHLVKLRLETKKSEYLDNLFYNVEFPSMIFDAVRCSILVFNVVVVVAFCPWSIPCHKRIIIDAGNVTNEITVKWALALPNEGASLEHGFQLIMIFVLGWNFGNSQKKKKYREEQTRSVNAWTSYVRHHSLLMCLLPFLLAIGFIFFFNYSLSHLEWKLVCFVQFQRDSVE